MSGLRPSGLIVLMGTHSSPNVEASTFGEDALLLCSKFTFLATFSLNVTGFALSLAADTLTVEAAMMIAVADGRTTSMFLNFMGVEQTSWMVG